MGQDPSAASLPSTESPAQSETAGPDGKATRAMAQAPTIDSRELFQGGRVVRILHEGREYWLRITSAGKLILTA